MDVKRAKREWAQAHLGTWVEAFKFLKSSSSIGMGEREQGRRRRTGLERFEEKGGGGRVRGWKFLSFWREARGLAGEGGKRGGGEEGGGRDLKKRGGEGGDGGGKAAISVIRRPALARHWQYVTSHYNP